MEVAEVAGDLDGAARAKMSVIEELSNQTPPTELAKEYEATVRMLTGSQDPATAKRLINCSVKIIDSLMPADESETTVEVESWEGFSFKREVLKIEKKFIERALRDAGGSVTRASRLLGFRHHQSLIALINSRHRDLLGTRSAVRKRRHHLFSKPRRARKPETASENGNKEADAVSGTVPTSEGN
jgi:hypothetical protein